MIIIRYPKSKQIVILLLGNPNLTVIDRYCYILYTYLDTNKYYY